MPGRTHSFLSSIFAVLLLAPFSCVAQGQAPEAEPSGTPPEFSVSQFKVEGDVPMPGLVYLPDGYLDGKEKWPLVIALHGAGQKGTDTEKLKQNGLPKLVAEGKKFPFVIVVPQCPSGGYWSKSAQLHQLDSVLETVIHDYRIDESRIYLTGFSMGAHGTWSWAATHPDRFAAIAPMAGGWSTDTAPRLAKLPIWTFHGDADVTVPFQQSVSMVEALRKAGAGDNLIFTVYPGIKHDCWTAAYANDALYTWLLLHHTQL